MKKTIAIIILMALTMGLVGGCASNGDDHTETPSETASSTAISTVAESTGSAEYIVQEPTTLTLWLATTNFLSQQTDDLNDLSVWKELEKRTNVHIEFIWVSSQQESEQFNLMLASQSYPDMVVGSADSYSGGASKAIDEGFALELTDIIDQYMPNYKQLRESREDIRASTQCDDGRIAQLYQIIKEDLPISGGPVIRQDWLDDLNLNSPVTYEDYYNVLTAFKNEKGADSALWLPNSFSESNYLCAGYGVAMATNEWELPFYVVDGTVKCGIIEDSGKEYLQMLNKWYTEGLIYKEFYKEWQIPSDLVLNNEVGIWYTNVAELHQFDEEHPDESFQAAGIQDAVQNSGDTNHLRTKMNVVRTGVIITEACKNVETAAKWMDYRYSEEGRTLENYGIEDEGYTIEDGKLVLSELILNNPAGLTVSQAQSIYAMGEDFLAYRDWNREIAGYTQAQTEAVNIWAKNDAEYVYPSYINLQADEQTAYSEKASDITSYAVENITKFIVGEKQLNEWDDYVNGLKSMGIRDLIALKQAAYDRKMS